jgi:hypothetical protein
MNASRAIPAETAQRLRWAGMRKRVLAYMVLNAIQIYFFVWYRILNPMRVRHRARLPPLAPGNLYACSHHAQATDGGIVGQLWFPQSLSPSVFPLLPWVLVTLKHLGEDWRETARMFHCIPVVQSTEGTNSREELRAIKQTLGSGTIMYFPGGTRANNLAVLTGDHAAGALARAREVRTITPIGIHNPAQPFRKSPEDPSCTLPRWVDQLLRRAATCPWPRMRKIARVLIAWDWGMGMRVGERPVLTIGYAMTPEQFTAAAQQMKAERESRGETVTLNQCSADFLVQQTELLRNEP